MKLGVRTKLFAAFAIVLVLTALVGVLGIVKLQEANAATRSLADYELPAIKAVLRAQSASTAIQRDMRQFLLTDDPAFRARARTSYESAEKRYNDNLATMTELFVTPQGKQELAAI